MRNSESIVEIASSLNAVEFTKFLDTEEIFYELLDCDNIMDYNDGFYNIVVCNPADGPDVEGEAFLFIDGIYTA